MRTIAVIGNETIRIGRVGENRAVQIIWPGLLEKWRELYGDGTVQLAVRRPKDTAPYPVVCEVSENDVTWAVRAVDTARHGIGECELTYLVGEKIAKSQTWATEILRSLTEDEMTEPPDDPAKAWYMEIRQEIGNLDNLETENKTNLVSAINEAAQSGGGGGTIDPAEIAQAVEDYLSANPIQETDPTVPAWAKQPEKPAYTAAEVGALPDTYKPPVDDSFSKTSTNPVQNKVVSAKLSEVESIAKGRATGHVFETETDMRNWIAANASTLNLGDNLYIRSTDVPDYWWDGTAAQPLETQKVDLTEYAKKSEVPAVDTTLTQSGQAADAAAVGTRLSSLSDEMLTEESDPTVPSWAKEAQKPSYTASEVGADPSGTAAAQVAAHNSGTDTHSDIRVLIQGLTDRLNALADSDDTTLDQLSEVVSYIKSNRSLIEAITTGKVSVADIVDNLTTNVSNKPLSAAQGVVIKTLIDALRNDKLDAAELTNAVNTALAQAKASGEFDGADGKSAYQYAQDGGYTGTEAAFAEKLAQEQLTGTTNDLTPTQVYDAVSAGIPVKVQHTNSTYGLLSFTAFNVAESLNVIVSQTIVYVNDVYILAELNGNKSYNTWGTAVTILAQKTDIPSALPNPNALTFTGAVTGSYDGSKPLTVNIPSLAVDDSLTQSGQAADAEAVGERLSALSAELDNFIASGGFSAPIVDSVDEMVDTSKQYILKSTGTIWAYKETTALRTVTENCDDGYTYPENSRLGSNGSVQTNSSYAGYTTTPFIDLLAYPVPFTLHLEGCNFIPNDGAGTSYTRMASYTAEQTKISVLNTGVGYLDSLINVSDSDVTNDASGNGTIHFTKTPKTNNNNNDGVLRYVRFSGKTTTTPKVYVTYEATVTETAWVDTGIQYGSGGLDAETAAKISELNNEGEDTATIKLLPKPVLDFYNAADYSDSDYSYSHLKKITYPCRADIPVPYTVKWNYNESAMRTTVAVDTRAIGTVNAYTMRTYDATGLNKFPIYNLLPNKTYYYKVTHVMADGSLVEAKSGSFTTSGEAWRLLYIDGTQNVRDLGGWTGLNGKKVKYGKIIRGAALNDSSFSELLLTGKGRRSLGELAIQAELNLGATDTETSIASNCVYKKIGYTNYAIAFTGEAYRAQFKEVLEWIVDCLTASKPVYMHCQGGCDRTGTLSFQLLGLLGVSESDLAKEYELSSFSSIGLGRLRTTTKAVDTYDYVGMVEALKAYSGATVADKFYDFATTGCSISADTIINFRNLMLE